METIRRAFRAGRIVFVRELLNEIKQYRESDRLVEWAENNRDLFRQPTPEELNFIKEIFANAHFRFLLKKKNILEGKPNADPFVIAQAKVENATVVTEERYKPNAAKIPNVCKHFKIPYLDLEGFMEREGWRF